MSVSVYQASKRANRRSRRIARATVEAGRKLNLTSYTSVPFAVVAA